MDLRKTQPCICSTCLPRLAAQNHKCNRKEVLNYEAIMAILCLLDYLLFPRLDPP